MQLTLFFRRLLLSFIVTFFPKFNVEYVVLCTYFLSTQLALKIGKTMQQYGIGALVLIGGNKMCRMVLKIFVFSKLSINQCKLHTFKKNSYHFDVFKDGYLKQLLLYFLAMYIFLVLIDYKLVISLEFTALF